MSRLPNKWLNSLLGDEVSLAVYLSSDNVVMRAQQLQGLNKTLQHNVEDNNWEAAITYAMKDLAVSMPDSVPLATVALASEHFDSYFLSFQELPNGKAEQQALVLWTLKKRKLIQDQTAIESRLRFQVMGKTANGYKLLVEILHADAADHLNALQTRGCVIADTVCRASHCVYNHVQRSDITAPAALLYCEPDTLSGYYWGDDGVLSFYRDHTLSAHGASSMADFATDVTSIIRRLEAGEWGKSLATVLVVSSSMSPAAGQALIAPLADRLSGVEIKTASFTGTADPVLPMLWGDQA